MGPPSISTQPHSQTVPPGGTAVFSVAAIGTLPLTYQWNFDGTNIAGATDSILVLTNVQQSQAGNYAVQVTNLYGSALSSNGILTVNKLLIITGFSPSSGAVGTVMSISGFNFSPVPSNNIVYFGATRAAVTAANPTNLTVAVPIGALYAPITDTVGGLTAYANSLFVVTCPGGGTIDSAMLDARVDLGAGSGPYKVAFGDLDGDGKPDLVVVNIYDATVMVYRNLSTNGSLAAGSFAPPVVLPVGGGSDSLYGLALADLDGDGRLDIVVANRNSNNVTIFQNLSVPGTISSNSFAGRVDLPVGAVPSDVAVRDLDGDGRPDIVTANYSGNSISILRNLSTPGMLTTNSFAPELELPASAGVDAVALGDVDGDGKPDVVTAANSGVSDVSSVFRNLSTPGNLGFAARVDFAGGGNSVAIGDLDGDGKPDLAVGSWDKQVLSLFRNTSSIGSITTNSFAARVDFAGGGNVHQIAIGDIDGDGKPDIALVSEQPSQLSLFKNTSTPGTIGTGSLAAPVVFSAVDNATGVAIGDLDGDGRPDIAFGNVYGGVVSLYRNLLTDPPLILTQPGNQTVAMGSNATFSVAVSGSAPLSYQWFFNATNPVSGAINATLTLTNVQLAQAGTYAVLASNAYGSTWSSNALLTVTAPPFITGQPQSLTVPTAGIAIFSVKATGTPPLSYQWRFDGTNLAGATNIELMLTNVHLSQAGNYDVLVTNVYGLALSSNASLTVLPPACVTLSNSPVAWWKGEGDGSDSAGSNSISQLNGVRFVPGEVGQAFGFDGGAHYVTVPDSPTLNFGSNQDFSIEVWVQPSTANPSNSFLSIVDKRLVGGLLHDLGYALSLGAGQLQFRMSDSLTGFSSAFGPAGPDLRDGSFHHLAVSVVRNSPTGGSLYVDGQEVLTFDPTVQPKDLSNTQPLRIGNPAGRTLNGFFEGAIDELSLYRRALSAAEILAIFNAGSLGKCPVPVLPFLTAQPQALRVLPGCAASFSVAAGGTTPLNYQWWKDGLGLNGQSNASLALASVRTNDFGNYNVVVTNIYGAVTSSIAALSLEQPPVAGGVLVHRFAEGGVRVNTAVLLAQDVALNGNTLAIIGVSSNTTAGGAATLNGNSVYYLPPVGWTNTDTFTYTVSDGQCGGATVGTVTVKVKPDDAAPLNFTIQNPGDGSLRLIFDGVPGWTYRVQYKDDLASPNWQALTTITADGYGVCAYADLPPANTPTRFYRAVGP